MIITAALLVLLVSIALPPLALLLFAYPAHYQQQPCSDIGGGGGSGDMKRRQRQRQRRKKSYGTTGPPRQRVAQNSRKKTRKKRRRRRATHSGGGDNNNNNNASAAATASSAAAVDLYAAIPIRYTATTTTTTTTATTATATTATTTTTTSSISSSGGLSSILRLRYRLVGSDCAPTKVLFIVGLATNYGWWLPQMEHVSRRPDLHSRVQLCVYDNRGSGRSETPVGPFCCSIEQMADDALHLLQHLGWTRVHVVGISMGGLIAQTLQHRVSLRRDPLELRSLVLISTFTWLWGSRHSLPMPSALHMILRTSPVAGLTQHKRLDAIFDTMFSSTWLEQQHEQNEQHGQRGGMAIKGGSGRKRTNRDMCHEVYGFMFRAQEMNLRGAAKHIVGIATHRFPAHRLRTLACRSGDGSPLPVLVIAGTGDRMVSHHNSYALYEGLVQAGSHARLEVFDGCGHIVTVECAERVNRLLFDDWLSCGWAATELS